MKKTEKPKNHRLKMTVDILCLAALFIIELYLMLNYAGEYLILGVIGLIMLCIVYRITDLYFRVQNEKEYRFRQEYEKIFKSSKVSYLFLRQSFSELSEELEEVKNSCSMPVDDLVEAQKAIAKVSINRSKENTTALMNSNDNLIERMLAFEEKLDELGRTINGDQNKEELQKIVQGMIDQQQQLSSQFREMKENIKEEIEKKTAFEESLVQKENNLMNAEEIDRLLKDTTEVLDSIEDEPISDLKAEPEESDPEAEEEIVEAESYPEAEEEIAEGEESDSEEEEIVEAESYPEEEPELVEAEESDPEEEEELAEPRELNPPANDDPNHVMTPEEIAALLGEISVEAEEEPEPVEEEKPAMPDLSDPGHVMTPEEIAALLANM